LKNIQLTKIKQNTIASMRTYLTDKEKGLEYRLLKVEQVDNEKIYFYQNRFLLPTKYLHLGIIQMTGTFIQKLISDRKVHAY
jgi:hypothetical protein